MTKHLDLSRAHALTVEQVVHRLGSSLNGLSDEAVQHRQQEHGLNVLPRQARAGWIKLFLRQFNSVLIIILLVAALVSYLLGDATDSVIILVAVLLNVIVGFVQEGKAERSLEALRTVITLEATVVREGEERMVPVDQVVPGDVVVLSAGDKVPADARLIEAIDIETNESALTGESTAVHKQLDPVDVSSTVGDRASMVFTGTTVTHGSGHAMVVATGVHTEIGRIAQLLHQTRSPETPLQLHLDRFARTVAVVIIAISGLLVLVGVWQGTSFVEIFTTAVAVAVSAIPEGLAVAVTVVLAVGMQRILKQRALVRSLQAAETLGSTSVICTDKTGTLTEGNMQVVEVVTPDYHFDHIHDGTTHEEKGLRELHFALTVGVLCNDAHVVHGHDGVSEPTIVGNLTERALLAAGMGIGLDPHVLQTAEPRVDTVPFDSTQKFMATLHKHGATNGRVYVKGAPERVIEMCDTVRSGSAKGSFTASMKKKFQQQFEEFSQRGLRILALAYHDVSKQMTNLTVADCAGLTFVGFVGIQDPLRSDVPATVALTAQAGIRTVMITGDHKLTATAIAREVGLPTEAHNILSGDELHAMTQEELNAIVEDISVYARVSPEDKLNIIKAWKSKGKVVAMTGDGVNDAPALKAADIGIALGSGTEVAKEASDMVLLENDYRTIVAAVEEGRGIFDNIRKVILYLLSDSFSEVILISGALFLGAPLPLTAAQILWINLIGDGFPGIALTVDPKDPGLMQQKPRSVREPVLNAQVSTLTIVISVITGLANIGVFWYVWKSSGSVDLARSAVFASLSVDSLLYVFSIRSLRHSIFHRSFFSNQWLFVAVVLGFLAQLAALYIPVLQPILGTASIGWTEWSVVLGVSVLVILGIEISKLFFRLYPSRV